MITSLSPHDDSFQSWCSVDFLSQPFIFLLIWFPFPWIDQIAQWPRLVSWPSFSLLLTRKWRDLYTLSRPRSPQLQLVQQESASTSSAARPRRNLLRPQPTSLDDALQQFRSRGHADLRRPLHHQNRNPNLPRLIHHPQSFRNLFLPPVALAFMPASDFSFVVAGSDPFFSS